MKTKHESEMTRIEELEKTLEEAKQAVCDAFEAQDAAADAITEYYMSKREAGTS